MSEISEKADFIRALDKLAQEESGKRQYYRPIYSLHKWWARRPGALFRAIILLASKSSTPEDLFISEPTGDLSIESDYFKDRDLSDFVILDPFMGGGTTLAESNRLGAKVIGCDLNPVSYWIVRESLKHIDLQKLRSYYRELELSVAPKIKEFYRTTCNQCGAPHADGLYYYWLRYVSCPHCGNQVYLYKRTLLNSGRSRSKPVSPANPATVFCPWCLALNEWNGLGNASCGSCDRLFNPRASLYDHGFFRCPHCGDQKISLIKTLEGGQSLHEELVAIEYWCPRFKDRLYKSPGTDDRARIQSVEKEFVRSKNDLIFPRQEILAGASSVRWRRHGFKYYYEVFSPRQLLAFHTLLKAILDIPERDYRDAMITVFSNSLEYNNMMTPYNFPHRKLHHLFNYHALPLTTMPVENCVWGVNHEGAGTFVNCFLRYYRAKEYCLEPFDRFKDVHDKVSTLRSAKEIIAAHFVPSFQELKSTERAAMLLCKDSAQLSEIPHGSVDLVITDPPYYDNIHYSELSNFFYVWLKNLVTDSNFIEENVPTEQEAIVNDVMKKSGEDYSLLLAGVFRECARVLKKNGRLIFTFHHTNLRAWWALFKAVVHSGFAVMDSFPVMSEYKVNPHLRNKEVLDKDLVFFCGRRNELGDARQFLDADLIPMIRNQHQKRILKDDGNDTYLRSMGALLQHMTQSTDCMSINYDVFCRSVADFGSSLVSSQKTRGKYTVERSYDLQLFDK